LQSGSNIESGHGAVQIDEIARAGALDLADSLRSANSGCDEANEQTCQQHWQLVLCAGIVMEHGVHIPIETQ
jgi:hypothetical protein